MKLGAEITGQEWADWKAKNTDPYGSRIFSYAEDWANLMESEMEAYGVDQTEIARVMRYLVDNADAKSRIADTDGITGFMYGAAVATLAKAWVHGEQLRRWHNLKTQIHNEGEKANRDGGTLNPALLHIG